MNTVFFDYCGFTITLIGKRKQNYSIKASESYSQASLQICTCSDSLLQSAATSDKPRLLLRGGEGQVRASPS